MAFSPSLGEHANVAGLCPSSARLAAEKSLDGAAPAVHFAFFDRQIDIARARITRHNIHLEAKGFGEKPWPIVTCRADSGSAALWRLRRLAHVFKYFVRGVSANIKDSVSFLRRSDPAKFAPNKLDLLSSGELFYVKTRCDDAEREAVGLGDIVDIVGSDHGTAARHVLHNEAGISGNVLAHVLCDEARPEVVRAARRKSDEDAHGLAIEKRRLGQEIGTWRDHKQEPEDELLHSTIPPYDSRSRRSFIFPAIFSSV